MKMYSKLCAITIFSTYLLILVGGIVRSTGAGMGCPDWPRCFDRWIPPTSESQLPEDYQLKLLEKRLEKNKKVNATFEKLGITIENEAHDTEEVISFNLAKAWIEYGNRIVGVLIGFFILLTSIFSLKYFSVKRKITLYSIAAFVLVLIEGYLGSIVVSSNLLPGLITAHMLLAIAIVFLLISAYTMSENTQKYNVDGTKQLRWIVIASIVMSVVQLALGTQIREAVDIIASNFDGNHRDEWIGQLGLSFYIHRSFSLLILATHVMMIWQAKKLGLRNSLLNILLGLVVIEVLTGAIMAYFAIPRVLQPVHLLLSTVMLGGQYYLLLKLPRRKISNA